MVTCNSYRNPALLAKMASTVDVLSHGRLNFGIGAGRFEHEYRAYGYDYPDTPGRLRHLREAVQVILAMWTQEEAVFEGKYYQVRGAINQPKGVQKPHIPLLIERDGLSEAVAVRFLLVCLFSRYSALPDCSNKSGVILPGLVGVRLSESSNSLLECITPSQVATDLSRVTRSCVGAGESPATEATVFDETPGVQARDIHRQLHVSQLPNVKVEGVRCRPSKEEIAGGLHDALSTDDPVSMARIATGAEVTFEDRSLGFLDL